MTDEQRKAFEIHARGRGFNCRRNKVGNGQAYVTQKTREMWKAFLAGVEYQKEVGK